MPLCLQAMCLGVLHQPLVACACACAWGRSCLEVCKNGKDATNNMTLSRTSTHLPEIRALPQVSVSGTRVLLVIRVIKVVNGILANNPTGPWAALLADSSTGNREACMRAAHIARNCAAAHNVPQPLATATVKAVWQTLEPRRRSRRQLP